MGGVTFWILKQALNPLLFEYGGLCYNVFTSPAVMTLVPVRQNSTSQTENMANEEVLDKLRFHRRTKSQYDRRQFKYTDHITRHDANNESLT